MVTELKRTFTFLRKDYQPDGFPELCKLCKASPAKSVLNSDIWGNSDVHSCDACVEEWMPAEMLVEETVCKRDTKLLKAVDEEQTVLGVVMEPDEVDAHGDTVAEDEIRKAAEDFLTRYGKAEGTKLGLQHEQFDKAIELLQSYVTDAEMKINGQVVKPGTWLMKVRVADADLWSKVKSGEITGFSIGGYGRTSEGVTKAETQPEPGFADQILGTDNAKSEADSASA